MIGIIGAASHCELCYALNSFKPPLVRVFGCHMAQNSLPFCLKPSLPIYAEDIDKVKESWHVLIAEGAKTIYPGHGKPFPIDAIVEFL